MRRKKKQKKKRKSEEGRKYLRNGPSVLWEGERINHSVSG
jgi:hypothetical protein